MKKKLFIGLLCLSMIFVFSACASMGLKLRAMGDKLNQKDAETAKQNAAFNQQYIDALSEYKKLSANLSSLKVATNEDEYNKFYLGSYLKALAYVARANDGCYDGGDFRNDNPDTCDEIVAEYLKMYEACSKYAEKMVENGGYAPKYNLLGNLLFHQGMFGKTLANLDSLIVKEGQNFAAKLDARAKELGNYREIVDSGGVGICYFSKEKMNPEGKGKAKLLNILDKSAGDIHLTCYIPNPVSSYTGEKHEWNIYFAYAEHTPYWPFFNDSKDNSGLDFNAPIEFGYFTKNFYKVPVEPGNISEKSFHLSLPSARIISRFNEIVKKEPQIVRMYDVQSKSFVDKQIEPNKWQGIKLSLESEFIASYQEWWNDNTRTYELAPKWQSDSVATARAAIAIK